MLVAQFLTLISWINLPSTLFGHYSLMNKKHVVVGVPRKTLNFERMLGYVDFLPSGGVPSAKIYFRAGLVIMIFINIKIFSIKRIISDLELTPRQQQLW